ncbi:MAG: polysaccharide pyruvyl transferase family protein [Chloroflexi bacterium]|nr:polysaccharide pyruvyl transferase family protein [Chloroflexota bacterium]
MSSNEDPSPTILIAGYYGYNNAGDEAILDGILAELKSLNKNLHYVVLSGDPAFTESLHAVEAIAWSDIGAMVEAVKSAALVIVGGGGLIQDYWGADEKSLLTQRQGGMSEFGAPILLPNLFGILSMFYAVGVGPLKTIEGRRFGRVLFDSADQATVRDQESLHLLEEIGTIIQDIPAVLDPAFYANPQNIPGEFGEQLKALPRPWIGVSLRYWQIEVQPPEWLPQVSIALDAVLQTIGGSVIFLPFHDSEYFLEDDLKQAREVQSAMQKESQTTIAGGSLHALQRFAVIEQFDLLLGMRLHSLVAALRAGIPCVGLNYDPKVGALMQGFQLGNYTLDLSNLDAVLLSQKLLSAYENKEYFLRVGEQIKIMRQSSSPSLQLAKNLLDSESSKPALPPLLTEFAINQTLNLAQAEGEMTRLSQMFQSLWALNSTTTSNPIITNLSWIEDRVRTDMQRTQTLEDELEPAREQMRSDAIAIRRLEDSVLKTETQLRVELEERGKMQDSLHAAQAKAEHVSSEMQAMRGSRGFRLLQTCWGVIWRIRDPKQTAKEMRGSLMRMRRWVARRLQPITSIVLRPLIKLLPKPWRHLRFIIRTHHLDLIDRSRVVLFTDDENLFPGYLPRMPIKGQPRKSVQVALVTTVKNESANAEAWLKDLERQTRIPDEVHILDGGSSDNTFAILEAFASQSKLNLKLYSKPDANIATRRNVGARRSNSPIIAMTDFGCSLRDDWLEKIIAPFEIDPDTEVVAGWYGARADTWIGEKAKYELVPKISDIEVQSFLPACRSIAFKKSVWEEVGGFAEWLTKTGEDTYFDLKLKHKARHWAFVPDARVIWHAPETLRGIWTKLSNWTAGDGESGAFAANYWSQMMSSYRSTYLTLFGLGLALGGFFVAPALGYTLGAIWLGLVLLGLAVDGMGRGGILGGALYRFGRAARVQGFRRGIHNRPQVIARRYSEAKGLILFLSGVPIDDTGGGARGTQIVLELLRRGNVVIFVHKYPKQENSELDLDFGQARLLHFSASDFDWPALQWEFQTFLQVKKLTAIVEFPFAEYLPIVRSVSKMGGKIVYDLIDEWNTSLGGDWYSPAVEAAIVRASDVLMASAPSLAKRLEKLSGKNVIELPNAVNLNIFDRRQTTSPPHDLPSGDPKILYIGALWGEWFDWELLHKIARANAEAALVVIGDYGGQSPFSEANVHFLGLKDQTTLPAYLMHADVAIIPWKISPITQATSPLKIFEYLAMGVPVVAPKLRPLADLPYVFLAEDHEEFLEKMSEALACKTEDKVIDAFLHSNSWKARIELLAEKVSGI